MKIFDFKNPRHIEILREELRLAKRKLTEAYAYDETKIWDAMSEDERWDAIASTRDDEGPDDADRYAVEAWDNIPDQITNLIDLSSFKLASSDIGGRTNLRAIGNFKKKYPETQKVIDAFLAKVGRTDADRLTIKQSYQLLIAVQRSLPSKPWNAGSGESNVNPYDMPGGRPSRGHLGGKWTGD